MKKIKTVFIITAICLAFTGCGAPQSVKTAASAGGDQLVWVTSKCAAIDSAVISKLNALLNQKGYHFSVTIKKSIDGFDQKKTIDAILKLMKSGKQADIIFSGLGSEVNSINNYYTLVKNNVYADIKGLLKTSDGKKLKAAFDDKFWNGLTINKKIYGVRVQEVVSYLNEWGFNKALVQKYKIDVSHPSANLWDMEGMLKKVYQGEKKDKNFSAFMPIDDSSLNCLSNYDIVTTCVGAALNNTSAAAVNIYSQNYVKKWIETIKRYSDLGYIGDNPDNYFLEGQNAYANNKSVFDASYGSKKVYMIFRNTGTYYVKQSAMENQINGIASWSKHKKEALTLLMLCNTDKEIANLLNYGIEGRNYTLRNNTVIPNKKIGYNYILNQHFFANYLLLRSEQGINLIPYSDYKSINTSAKSSPILGFYFDESSVAKEVTATDKVVQKYENALWTGSESNADTTLAQMQKELRAAGIDKVVAEVNRQIAVWKKSK